jgi:chromosome segregation ATPase
MKRIFPLLLCAVLPVVVLSAADQTPSAEAQLRDAVKNLMRQVATAQSDLATAQAAAAQAADETKADDAKIKALIKSRVDDKAAADQAVAALNAKIADQATELAQVKAELERAKATGEAAAALATNKEAERAALQAANNVLERTTADRETRNVALFKLANEILDRYEKFSLGQALAAKEPFVGTTRTRLQNLVQDYKDKILEQHPQP